MSHKPLPLHTVDITQQWYETAKSVNRHDTTSLREGERYVLDAYLSGNHILDIGCSTGRFTAYLKDSVGIDYSQAMIDRARLNHPNISFHRMDVRDMAHFPDSSFNAAVFTFYGFIFVENFPIKGGQMIVART